MKSVHTKVCTDASWERDKEMYKYNGIRLLPSITLH